MSRGGWSLPWVAAGLLACAIDERDVAVQDDSSGAMDSDGVGILEPSGSAPPSTSAVAADSPMESAPGPSGAAAPGAGSGPAPSATDYDATPTGAENSPDVDLDDASSSPAGDEGEPRLTARVISREFPPAEVGTQGSSQEWTITNAGTAGTGALALSSSNNADFDVVNGCPVSLGAGESCRITIAFSPDSGGAHLAALEFGNAEAGRVTATVTGIGRFRVSLRISGGGRVSGLGAGPCAGECSALVDPDSEVSLAAEPVNGSQLLFQAWSLPSCPGPLRTCTFVVRESLALGATFTTLRNNLMFTSSETFPADLGGVAAYDARCNALASNVGINSADGRGYVAMISDATGSFLDRLSPGVHGWIRMDGRPVLDSFESLIEEQALQYPPHHDERGATTYNPNFSPIWWTGTTRAGDPSAANCANWTNAAANQERPSIGLGNQVPFVWTEADNASCADYGRIVCLGNTSGNPLLFPGLPGKRIWVSDEAYTPGTRTPDAHCAASAPPGVALSAALIAYTNRPAAAVLEPDTNYLRFDGVSVGTGAQLTALTPLTGIWITGRRTVLGAIAWTGQTSLQALGTTDSTCNDWRGTIGTSPVGVSQGSDTIYWNFFAATVDCADGPAHLYCVER